MCSKNCDIKVKFSNEPENLSWNVGDNEVILFQKKLCPICTSQISVDAVISSEISGLVPPPPGEVVEAYNVYRLYINDKQVCQSGYEAEADLFAPNLSSSSLIWGGKLKDYKSLYIKVTAQLIEKSVSSQPISSNVDNSAGNFQGAKGAFLKIITF